VTCRELEALAAELALGTVSGAERAQALDHLARCAPCREMVDQLSRVADCMLLLAPVAEPPPGFESKVLARMGVRPAPVTRLPSRRRILVGVAAVALVAALSGATAATLVGEERAPEVRTALAVDDEGRWTCRAVVYGVDPTWLVVSLDRTDDLSTSFSVEALHTGSSVPVPVGSLTIKEGHGSLTTAVGLPPEAVKSVRVLDGSGRVRYEVKLPEA
jgi:anti-sigma-K factor RskA